MEKTGLLQARWFLLINIALGFSVRMIAAWKGHNYDMYSFMLVADIVEHGGNVYVETTRYNYGPVWFNILSALHQVALALHAHHDSYQELIFRYLIAGFVSFVDIGIFLILRQKRGGMAAYLFLLNPISIIITGFHSQFDNLALLIGMLSVIIIGDNFDTPLSRRKLAGLVVLGFSLMTKHILFAFPFWLAVKQRGILQKVVVVSIPIFVFLSGFIPYWNVSHEGIIQNVLMYQSKDNAPFFRLFIPPAVGQLATSQMIWFILLGFFAFVFRPKDTFDSLLFYTCVLVAASPAIANQYLAIVIPFISSNTNLFFSLYTLLGTWYLLVNQDGFGFSQLESMIGVSGIDYYVLLVFLLCCGFIWLMWRQSILIWASEAIAEAKIQLGRT